MALSATAIATAIAGLTITGVTVKDLGAVPDTGDIRSCPVLFPNPNNWIAGGIGSSEESEGPATFGPGMWVFQRAFSYLYLHALVGQGRGLSDHMSAMSTNLDAILTAFTTLDVSGVDVMEIDCGEFAVVTDPAGKQFYGFTIAVAMKERINA
jgi:hypothetical protein